MVEEYGAKDFSCPPLGAMRPSFRGTSGVGGSGQAQLEFGEYHVRKGVGIYGVRDPWDE